MDRTIARTRLILEQDILEVAFIQDLAVPEMLSYIPCVLDMIDDPFDWDF